VVPFSDVTVCTDPNAQRDVPVWVISTSGVLSAAVAAGLEAIGWRGARPATGVSAGGAGPPTDQFKIVAVADEDDVLPELAVMVHAVDGPVVAVVQRGGGRSWLKAVEYGALVVDADQPLQAQLRAVDRALAGGRSVPDRDALAESARRWVSEADRVSSLTTRESEVLDLLMCGYSAGEMAGQFVVSLPTIRTHIRAILQKLGVSSQLAAVAMACRSRCGLELRRCRSHQL